jgi:hypothetical protein
MAVNYRASLKTSRMQAVLTDIDNNAAPAKLQIFNAAFATKLAEITLAKPSHSLAGAVLTMLGVPLSDASADATGNAAVGRIVDGSGATILDNLSVGTSGTDIILNSAAITAGQTVTITAGTITHSA